MSTPIEQLDIILNSSSSNAEEGVDKLISTLQELKKATKGGLGLKSLANNLKEISAAGELISSTSAQNISKLADAVEKLKDVSGIKISSSIGNQISSIASAASALNGADFTKVGEVATALAPLSQIGKGNLNSWINQLSKLPKVFSDLRAADIDGFAKDMQKVADAIKPLANEMAKVSAGFSSFPSKIQKLINSTDKLAASNKRGANSYMNLYAKIMLVRGALMGVARFIAGAVNEANEYVENVNLFNVAMGEFAAEGREYAETVKTVMGIDPSGWMRNQGIFQTLATGFGIAGDRANIMSKNLTQLGYDISSFFNVSIEDAMQKLQSGLSGELEPLRRLGYDLSQAKLEATALSLGIDKSVSSMTQAEKAQLRYYAILTQVTTAQGDMARTLESPANQLRIFKEAALQAGRAIGTIFLPALQAILPIAIAVMQVVELLASTIAKLFGYKADAFDFGSFGGLASGAEDAETALDGAAKAAKKLKSYTLGFDELNIIDPNSGSGSGNGKGAGIGGGAFDFELPEYDFLAGIKDSPIGKMVEDMKEWLGLTGEINSWADFFDTKLGDILKTIVLAGAALALWKISDTLLNDLDKVVAALRKLGKGVIFTVGVVLAAEGIDKFIEGFKSSLSEGLDGANLGQMLAGALMGTGGFAAIGYAIGGTIGSSIGLGIALAAFGIPMAIAGLDDAAKNGIDLLNAATIALGTTAFGAGVGAIIGSLGGPIGAGIGALAGLAAGLIVDFVIFVCQHFDEIKLFFQNLGTALWKIVSGIGEGIAVAIGTTFSAAFSLLAIILEGALDACRWFATGAGDVFKGIWSAIKKVVNLIIGGIEWMVNTAIKGVNKLISALNSLSFDMPDWLGGGTFGLSIPTIATVTLPRLAQGGMVDTGQLFIAREAGAEIVGNIGRRTGVMNNDQIVESVAGGVATANMSVVDAIYTLIGVVESKDLNVNIGDDSIGRSYDRYSTQRGRRVNSGAFANAY